MAKRHSDVERIKSNLSENRRFVDLIVLNVQNKMGQKPKSTKSSLSAVVISYVPLLIGDSGIFLDPSDRSITGLTDLMGDLPDGSAAACIWFIKDDMPIPVLVFDGMSDMINHLEWWAEGKTQEWFNLKIVRKDEKYAVVLTPKLEKSVERWNVSYQLKTGFPPPKDTHYSIIFRPLHFVSGSKTVFEDLSDKLGQEMKIGFVDLADVNRDNPGMIDDQKIRMLGPFPVIQDLDPYLESMIDNATEPPDAIP